MTRSSFQVPAARISSRVAAKTSRARSYTGGLPGTGSELDEHLGVGLDLLLEGGRLPGGEGDDRVLAPLEDDVPDLLLDVGGGRLEQVPGDVPGLEDAPAHDGVEADA